MAPPNLFLDVSRLVRRFEHLGGPTGVDRVEARYVRWLLAQDQFAPHAVTRAGRTLASLPLSALERVLATVEARWASEAPPGFGREGRSPARFALERARGRLARWHLLGRAPAATFASGRTIYLNVGQDGLDAPQRMASFPGARAVLVHDIIPITHPEYDSARLATIHARRIANVAAHASHVFTNSEATRAALCAHVGPHAFTSSVAWLAPALSRPASPQRYLRPTFVHLSSVNRRKNLALLLHVWREMAHSPRCPDLVVIGRRGNDATALELIDRAPVLAERVRVLGAVNDGAAAAYLAGARALLTPSFAEGFGLPIVEAHAMGVPVIASDIAAHREIGGPGTRYLSPLDGAGWRLAIETLANDEAAHAAAVRAILPPPTWEAHFAAVADRLHELMR